MDQASLEGLLTSYEKNLMSDRAFDSDRKVVGASPVVPEPEILLREGKLGEGPVTDVELITI